MQKILLVEDDPLIFRLYKKIFTLEGFEIEVAENGQLGLDKLKTYTPDIILLDIMMRTMNGLEMLGDLKMNPSTAKIPVVVLTNVSDMKITGLAKEKGAEQVLIKSESEPDDVIGLVRGILAQPSDEPLAKPGEPAASDEKPEE